MNRCPHIYHAQLVEWAKNYFKEPAAKFSKMNKDQLQAIWYRIVKLKPGEIK
jgi:hypothetical protein